MSDFNIGRDATMTILVDGLPIGAIKLTNFEAKQLTTRLTSKPLNSEPAFRENEEGWEGTADADRTNSVLDDFFAQKEAGYYSGRQPPVLAITQTIRELNGATSRYRFEGIAVKMDDAGTYKADDKVMQKMGFVAARRKKV